MKGLAWSQVDMKNAVIIAVRRANTDIILVEGVLIVVVAVKLKKRQIPRGVYINNPTKRPALRYSRCRDTEPRDASNASKLTRRWSGSSACSIGGC